MTDEVISDVILTHYNAHSTEDLLCTESHIPLLTTYRQNDDGSLKVTAYLMVLYLELARDGDWFHEQSGSHIPTALTFHVQPDGSCTLTEYWEPNDGSRTLQTSAPNSRKISQNAHWIPSDTSTNR